MFVNKPTAIPPKAICDSASPKSECLLNTRNSPTAEHMIATAMPVMSALWIKPASRISNTIFFHNLTDIHDSDDDDGDVARAYAPACLTLNISLEAQDSQRTHETCRGRTYFYLYMPLCWQGCLSLLNRATTRL